MVAAFDRVGGVSHVVTTPVFEGPIDLLLHLVSTHEVDVLDIPLGAVVEGFVAYLGSGECRLDTMSEFLLIAAILVELKSQRLLPGPDGVEEDEELVGWEERDVLLGRLLECRAYAAAADAFTALAEQAARSVPREAGMDRGFAVHAPDLLSGVSPEHLAEAYLRATAERPTPRVDLSHVTVDTVTVAETVRALAEALPKERWTTFRRLTGHLVSRIEVIVHFLALLELCKQGRISLGQGSTFGDLRVEWLREEPGEAAMAGALLGGDRGVDEYDG